MASREEKPAEKPLSPEVQPLQELYDLMLEKGLDAVELKDENQRIKLTRRMMAVPAAVAHAAPVRRLTDIPVEAAAPTAIVPMITTPLAGVFYRASSPNSASFVKEGDVTEVGQTLCIVEAMKVMNEIKAEARCKIIRIVVENGRPVTAGQALFHIEPA